MADGARSDDALNAALKALQKDLKALRDDVSTLKDDSAKAGRAGAKYASSAVEDGVEELSRRGKSVMHDAEEEVRDSVAGFRQGVRQNPMTAIATALTVGVILGQGLSRR